MSQHRLSPIASRPSASAVAGEKSHALPDPIPEENVKTVKDNQDEKTPSVEKSGWLSSLKLDMTKTEWDILIASTCLKLLLFPA